MSEEKTPKRDDEQELKRAGEINGHLEERIQDLNKNIKVTMWGGLLIIAVIIAYLGWLYGEFSEVMKAETMAEFVSAEVRNRIPKFGKEIEGQLKAEAPNVVNTIRHTVVNESLPAMRKTLQKQFGDLADEFFRTAPDLFMEEVYVKMVQANKQELVWAYAMDPEAYKAGDKRKELIKKLTANFDKSFPEGEQDALTKKLNESAKALRNIQKGLKVLGKKGRLDREEKLMKRLITSWWSMLGGGENLAKGEWKEMVKKAGGATEELLGDPEPKEPKEEEKEKKEK